MIRELNVPTSTILKIVGVLLGLWFLYIVRDVIMLLFISLVLVAAIEPTIDKLERKKIPRAVGVLIIYLILLLLLGLLVSFLVPSIGNQLQEFAKQLPAFGESLSNAMASVSEFFRLYNVEFNTQQFFQDLADNLSTSSGRVFSTTVGVFSGIISVIVVLSLTFYMSVRRDGIRKFLVSITPSKNQQYVSSLVERIKYKMGRWMQGQLLLMVIIFTLDYFALLFMGVPFALTLAIIGGIFEVIPYIGPTLAVIPAAIAGFLVSPLIGILVILAYILIQQIENHIITPQIMNKAVGLNPITVILALMIGGKIFGVPGIILAVPAATAISVFLKDVMEGRQGLEGKV